MCPDLVKSAQRIAAENPNVTAEVYDIHHFEGLKNQYQIMSVPCMIMNDQALTFGKKTIEEILSMIESGSAGRT
jgi:thioredoxin reductase (NADPH)